jgi:hypothetical protein
VLDDFADFDIATLLNVFRKLPFNYFGNVMNPSKSLCIRGIGFQMVRIAMLPTRSFKLAAAPSGTDPHLRANGKACGRIVPSRLLHEQPQSAPTPAMIEG